jgi:hypothetical protein
MSVVVTALPVPGHRAGQGRAKGAALAGLRSALEGKLSSGLDTQVLVPHPPGNAQKGAL